MRVAVEKNAESGSWSGKISTPDERNWEPEALLMYSRYL